MSETVYITTPIYYVNDRPHIGHVYTTTICDVYARHQRFAGRDVFFLTGTDEHGIKVQRAAEQRGISPQALADENAAEFRQALALFGLTNDDFIRTTQPDHERQVQALLGRLEQSGAVYVGEFEGWYDEGEEEYYTETRARELDYKSPVSGRPLVRAREENCYFRLSAWQQRLEQLLEERPDFVRPEGRRNEVLGRLRKGLQDVPITRTNFTWGVPMPGHEGHVIYVWIDALLNYVTALGLGEPGGDRHGERSRYWPATYHVMGKEILWFHAVIWPALLMALDLPLPKCVYAHSFWISEGQKMSKSLGNFIDLPTLRGYIDEYGLDALRYYLVMQGPLGAADADFTIAHFQEVYSTDLANAVGNCASRVTAMINRYFDGALPGEGAFAGKAIGGVDWPDAAGRAVQRALDAMDRLDLAAAVAEPLALIRALDRFIHETEPFKLAKDTARMDEVGAILYRCAETLRIASLLLAPVMPEKMAELWNALGLKIDPADGELHELARWGAMRPGQRIEKAMLFPRVEAAKPPKEPHDKRSSKAAHSFARAYEQKFGVPVHVLEVERAADATLRIGGQEVVVEFAEYVDKDEFIELEQGEQQLRDRLRFELRQLAVPCDVWIGWKTEPRRTGDSSKRRATVPDRANVEEWCHEIKKLVDSRTDEQLTSRPRIYLVGRGPRLERGECWVEKGSYPILSRYCDSVRIAPAASGVPYVASRFDVRCGGVDLGEIARTFLSHVENIPAYRAAAGDRPLWFVLHAEGDPLSRRPPPQQRDLVLAALRDLLVASGADFDAVWWAEDFAYDQPQLLRVEA